MSSVSAVRALGLIDLTSVHRDPMLRWLIFYPVVITAGARWGVPVLTQYLTDQYRFDLLPYYPLLASFLILVMPGLVGVIAGFILLDQRDDGTLMALQVTPLTLTGYLVYRVTVPVLTSLVLTSLLFPWAGLADLGGWQLVAMAAATAPLAALYALFLAGFAANKVQGFALMKAAGVLMIPPMVAFFVDSPWQMLAGVVPHYWLCKTIWLMAGDEPGVWLFGMAGLAYQILLLVMLLRRFQKVSHR